MCRFLVVLVAFLVVLVACNGPAAPHGSRTDAADPGADAADAADPSGVPPDFCAGTTAARYDPGDDAEPPTLPDDFFTVDDPGSATGVHVALDADAPWRELPGYAEFAPTLTALSTLDGWGTTAGIVLRFTAPVHTLPSGAPASVEARGLQLVALRDAAPARRVPFEVQVTDDGATAILWPMVPLAPATRHGVVVTTAQRDAAGGCIAPSATLRSVLAGDPADPRLVRLVPRYRELLQATGVAAAEVSHAVVFTTQTIVADSVAVAADIAQRSYAWVEPPSCGAAGPLHRRCDGAFRAWDYRTDGTIPTDPGGPRGRSQYELQVRIWLPIDAGPAPWPTLIYGHGLSSGRQQGQALADRAAPRGFATAAIDAVAHEDHPDSLGPGPTSLLAFFAIEGATGELRPLVLRDNWRQATYDKLQLIHLLRAAPDVDGDGAPDLDRDRLGYLGASLGGAMGSELLALADTIRIGVLSVPGARVASIISDSPMFSVLIDALRPPGVTDGDVDRFFPLLQTVLERGDGANYAPHVLTRRLAAAGPPPHLLIQMAIDDQIMPNVSTRALARALDIPHLAPVAQEIGLVPVTHADPVVGNLQDGAVTAALFQFDRITRDPGEPPVAATHDHTTKSEEGMLQALHFFDTWITAGVPEVIEPYAALGTPPL